eukprot:4800939-Pyramimonas_sp.AAC.1
MLERLTDVGHCEWRKGLVLHSPPNIIKQLLQCEDIFGHAIRFHLLGGQDPSPLLTLLIQDAFGMEHHPPLEQNISCLNWVPSKFPMENPRGWG